MKYVLGFDIGGTKSVILLAGPDKESVEFLEKEAIPTHGTWKEVLGYLADKGKTFLESHQISGKEYCIGISCGGPLDGERGMILSPPNLPGWDQVPIMSYLEQCLDMDARLKDGVDACALAEWRYGIGRGCCYMIFLTFGAGLGAGLVLNGRLYERACGIAGEAGCVRPAGEGPMGYEKAGGLEGFCSGGGIARLARSMAKDTLKAGRPISYMKEGGLGDIIAKDMAEATEVGCTDAEEILIVPGRYFGRGLIMLVDILSPERTVAEGIHARAGRFSKDEMGKKLQREAFPVSINACCILPCGLGEQIGDYGTVVAALEMQEEWRARREGC